MTAPNEKVIKLRDELFKKYSKEISEGDLATVGKIEKELLELAKKELKGNPGMDIYDSGSRGSFSNNYKNTAIMRRYTDSRW